MDLSGQPKNMSTVLRLRASLLIPVRIVIFLALFGGWVFLCHLTFPESAYNFLGESKHAELTNGASVTQVFKSRFANLEGVKIRLNDDWLYLGESIHTRLLDASCREEIARQTFSYFSSQADPFRIFSFSRIHDSAEKQYCLSITYFSPYARNERPEILASEGGAFSAISYTDTGKQKIYEGRSLQIRPLYGADSVAARLEQLENRLSQYKPFPAKGRILSLGAMLVLLSVLFFRILSKELNRQK